MFILDFNFWPNLAFRIQHFFPPSLLCRLGVLTGDEMNCVRGALATRLGIEQKAT
jgi:hypothetical protein